MSRTSVAMIVLCSALFASCGAHPTTHQNTDPTVPLDDPNACPVSVMLDANATFEAGFFPRGVVQSQPGPQVLLDISNSGPCPHQGTNCDVPAVIGGVTMSVALSALDANATAVAPQAGTYPVVTVDPNTAGALSAQVKYFLTTSQDLNPSAIALTAGSFVIDSIAWTPAVAPAVPEVTSLTGHAAFTLPDGSAFTQAFTTTYSCGR